MDTNKFKQSQNFDNLEKNKANNPNLDSNPNKLAQDYVSEMKSKKEEATLEGFMKKAKDECPPDSWEDKEKDYNEAWENNKNFSGDSEE